MYKMSFHVSRIVLVAAFSLSFVFAGTGAHASSDGVIAVASSTYSVPDAAGSMAITVTRTGGTTGAASVNYLTLDGTAVGGINYAGTNGEFNWANGDSSSRTITVKILPVASSSGKAFSLHLWAAAGAQLSAVQNATVTIGGSTTTSPPPTTTSSGVVGFAVTSYPINVTSKTVNLAVTRTGGAGGAASLSYLSLDGTATSGNNYSPTNGVLTWANGDASTKTISVNILDPTSFVSGKTFSVHLWGVSGAQLSAAQNATITINGAASAPSAGLLEFSTSSYSVAQSAGAVTLTIGRAAGSAGAAGVTYSTASGTAMSGVNFTSASNALTWASGDTSVRNISIPILSTTPYLGAKSLTVNLSKLSGAGMGTPSSATVTIQGTATAGTCVQGSGSWVSQSVGADIFDWHQYGDFVVQADNWGNLPAQVTWANSQNCWGITDSRTTESGSISSYPHATRGWMESSALAALSTPGTNDWTTTSGMGIAVGDLTKAKLHWAYTAPPALASRWDALEDIYFHTSATPAGSEFPPSIDLQIIQSLADQVINNSTFYGIVATGDHASTVTLGGNTYMIFVDDAGGTSFHLPGGHTIALFNLPTSFSSDNANPNWGVSNAVTDVAAIVKYLMQSNPLDDAGQPLLNAAGIAITSPLIPSNLYLTAINTGWEVDFGTTFSNTALCVAMQAEPDCPQ